jgi:hypothetical protein
MLKPEAPFDAARRQATRAAGAVLLGTTMIMPGQPAGAFRRDATPAPPSHADGGSLLLCRPLSGAVSGTGALRVQAQLAVALTQDSGTGPDALEVVCEVATDAGFSDVLRACSTVARHHRDYAVDVTIADLPPAGGYWYRIHALGRTSVGRYTDRMLPQGPGRKRIAAGTPCG